MDFERVLLSLIGLVAVIAIGCLISFARDRRRQRKTSIFATLPTPPAPARRKLPAPTMLEFKTDPNRTEVGNPRQEAHQRRMLATMSDAEYNRQSNHGMY
jgi:hypothetical protein